MRLRITSPKKLRARGILGMNQRNVDLIAAKNPRNLFPLVDDKLKTKRVAERAGIAVPKLLAVVSQESDVRNLAKTLAEQSQFAVKPSKGSGGKGILVITRREGDQFYKTSGDPISMGEIQHHISNTLSGLYSLGGRPDVAMIEALVQFDPVFDKYSYEGVPDIRVIVYMGYPVMAMLRLATHQSDGKANLHQGAVGVGIDLATGRALLAVQHGRPVTHHPDTGEPLAAIAIPHWERLLPLAAACYDVTKLGYLGVDIVLDRNLGPLIIELNARPGLAIQVANAAGLVPRLKLVDQLNETPNDWQQRAAWSKQNFGTALPAVDQGLEESASAIPEPQRTHDRTDLDMGLN